ncbi:unnamed protein product [Cuscuta campestris]|uniref:Uncharacterized protein n=1 Tax=Cuscuta campestris TaxID=132261 RepID=A0A484MXK8_9ASTE|nr:unnamed protein product [Cuscuta campestris]
MGQNNIQPLLLLNGAIFSRINCQIGISEQSQVLRIQKLHDPLCILIRAHGVDRQIEHFAGLLQERPDPWPKLQHPSTIIEQVRIFMAGVLEPFLVLNG